MNEEPIESPCNDVCKLDEQTGWCLGCYRTLAEIGSWSSLAAADKRAVIERSAKRREAAAELRAERRAAR